MKHTIADGKDYFGMAGFPITVRRVYGGVEDRASHPHDLTKVQHTHDFCELVIVTKGSGLQWLEGRDFPVTAGDVFLLQGHQRHYFHQREGLELINVMFDPGRLSLPENELRKLPGYCAMFLLEPMQRRQHGFSSRLHLKRVALAHLEKLAADMEEEVQEQGQGFEAVLFSKLLDMIVYLSRSYMDAETTEAQALLRVGKVIGALESDFSKEWSLQDLLGIAHMSRSNFMRIFRRATGQTPIEYLIRLRIQNAMYLLRRTDWTITRISADVGFHDSNYFSRQFKKAQNQSPSEYRKSVL